MDVKFLQIDLNNVITWCNKNGMLLNVNKCYHVSYTKRVNRFNNACIINNTELTKINET